jgi:hypothetical protein
MNSGATPATTAGRKGASRGRDSCSPASGCCRRFDDRAGASRALGSPVGWMRTNADAELLFLGKRKQSDRELVAAPGEQEEPTLDGVRVPLPEGCSHELDAGGAAGATAIGQPEPRVVGRRRFPGPAVELRPPKPWRRMSRTRFLLTAGLSAAEAIVRHPPQGSAVVARTASSRRSR